MVRNLLFLKMNMMSAKKHGFDYDMMKFLNTANDDWYVQIDYVSCLLHKLGQIRDDDMKRHDFCILCKRQAAGTAVCRS